MKIIVPLQLRIAWRTLGRAAGLGLVLGGLLTLIEAGRNVVEMLGMISPASASGELGVVVVNIGFGLIFAGISLACISAGYQIARERPVRAWVLLAGLLPQLLSVVVSGFQYRFSPAGFIGLGAYSVGQIVRVGFLFRGGSQLILSFDSMDEWVVQLNLASLAVGALILSTKSTKFAKARQGIDGDD